MWRGPGLAAKGITPTTTTVQIDMLHIISLYQFFKPDSSHVGSRVGEQDSTCERPESLLIGSQIHPIGVRDVLRCRASAIMEPENRSKKKGFMSKGLAWSGV